MVDEVVPEVIAEFKTCSHILPNGKACGSTRLMMAELGKEMKEKGMIGEDTDVGLNELGGTLISRDAAMKLLAPTIIPGNYALTDVCIGCGNVRVFKIMRKPTLAGTTAMGIPPGGFAQ